MKRGNNGKVRWKGNFRNGKVEQRLAGQKSTTLQQQGKKIGGIRQAAVFNLMWPHVRFVQWSHICVRSSENLYSEVFNNYGMSENLGAMHNAQCALHMLPHSYIRVHCSATKSQYFSLLMFQSIDCLSLFCLRFPSNPPPRTSS